MTDTFNHTSSDAVVDQVSDTLLDSRRPEIALICDAAGQIDGLADIMGEQLSARGELGLESIAYRVGQLAQSIFDALEGKDLREVARQINGQHGDSAIKESQS